MALRHYWVFLVVSMCAKNERPQIRSQVRIIIIIIWICILGGYKMQPNTGCRPTASYQAKLAIRQSLVSGKAC